MVNTLIYYDNQDDTYTCYRKWDSKRGSLRTQASSTQMLGEEMKLSRLHFKDAFKPIGGIPNIDFGNRDFKLLRPATEVEVQEVIRALSS